MIGDIHGRADLLEALLDTLDDRPVLVAGDLCDRGPETDRVLELLIARGAIGVMGNHDLWLGAWAAGEGFDPFALSYAMGGYTTLRSYGVAASVEAARAAGATETGPLPPAHTDFLLGLHLVIDLEVAGKPYWVIHAGVPSDRERAGVASEGIVPWFAEHHPTDLMWRKTPPETMLPVDRPIIMGHCPRPEPLDLGHVLAIDTGAGHGHALTALRLPERDFVTVR